MGWVRNKEGKLVPEDTEGEHLKMRTDLIALAKGLIQIAETAMPDTYLATDSRVKRARRVLKRYGVKGHEAR